jgi:rhamnose utilization protein RhaD (predicted bifunctional aldolase and dehydrogenase)
MSNNHQAIRKMCADLGNDPLMVQGAGGNVSWKEKDTLWIKGSGAWLASALDEDIFVPVHLKQLQEELANQCFDVKPKTVGEHPLRPSIETILHALMPQHIVVHLHAINPLSYLVAKNCEDTVRAICQKTGIKGAFVSYHKPGPQLAKAIHGALKDQPKANIIFLKNHGIVIGGDSVEEIDMLLILINAAFPPRQSALQESLMVGEVLTSPIKSYMPFGDKEVQNLAFNKYLFNRLKNDWVLFPDHAVFLGASANVFSSWDDFQKQAVGGATPELIFVENAGVYIKPEFNQAKTAQLHCYYDVISRVLPEDKLEPLDELSVLALLDWDAEKHRQRIMK